MIPVEPTAFSHREVLSNSSTATRKPSSTGPMGHADRAVEVDLRRGEDARPELVLQPADASSRWG